jgi:hypothetical protein
MCIVTSRLLSPSEPIFHAFTRLTRALDLHAIGQTERSLPLTDMTEAQAATCVSRGVALLDAAYPYWEARISWWHFDPTSHSHCALGQLHGGDICLGLRRLYGWKGWIPVLRSRLALRDGLWVSRYYPEHRVIWGAWTEIFRARVPPRIVAAIEAEDLYTVVERP